jgi:hypothetical protein
VQRGAEQEDRGRTSLEEQEYKKVKTEYRKTHRMHVQNYLAALDLKLECDAETDSMEFWKEVNSRKSTGKTSGAGIKLNGEIYISRESLVEQWKLYFENLYKCSESEYFDGNWKDFVDTTVDEVMTSCRTDQRHITSACAIKTLPNGKSGGPDGIVYEHLRLSKEIISPSLDVLFTNMLRHAFIPKDMKRGIIITLHKGGNKKKDYPNCYRAITLSSCILKLYELMLF